MARVTFFEKSGCAANARQKALLLAAGHELDVRDLRRHFWSNLRLLEFFADLPVAKWFNPAAPAVRSGAIVPQALDEATALVLLRSNPLLIRRPLLQVGDERRVGFDAAAIDTWIGLRQVPPDELESCRSRRFADDGSAVAAADGGEAPRRRAEPANDDSRRHP
ncbi:ArsC/Spx/MgsR family protein [Accumulibacter sp.]|jgi:nitrogenase-associated protein|uniref:ArsC/Spx/MgsR family protein n=1 Tax=Accumulibacter sp. TaxID=2053492 RepID=UPI001AD435E3|nr:ArsC/Spx/MgsR family protein [Accumulibacter sp.]MBN8456048.1 hypothetical protein [Accumulibacter sp.]MBO3709205.1 hypothetical protein [Accumulibacter sp.]